MTRNFFLFVLLLLWSACYTTFYTVADLKNYDPNIRFKITQVDEGNSIAMGNGSYRPSRGNKFVIVHANFSNESDETREIDFDNIYLIDSVEQTKSRVEMVLLPGPVNVTGRIEPTIKARDTKVRKMVFVFPKNRKAEYLAVNGNLFQIRYRQ